MSTTPLVTVEEVVKAYDGVVAVDRVGMQIAPGEVVGLVGKNGAGKSTLIKILAGAERADAGQVLVNGQPLPAHYAPHVAHELGLAFMHQELAIVADMSVAENIALGSRFPRQAKVLISKGALDRNAAEVLAGLDPDDRSEGEGRRPQQGEAADRDDRPGALPRRAPARPRRAERVADRA